MPSMLVEPSNISGKGPAPPAQARAPVQGEAAQEDVKVKEQPDPSRLPGLVKDVQENLTKIHDVHLQFTVHQASGRMMIKVMDESTGRVIREVPPAEVLNLAARLDKIIGLIFDQKG